MMVTWTVGARDHGSVARRIDERDVEIGEGEQPAKIAGIKHSTQMRKFQNDVAWTTERKEPPHLPDALPGHAIASVAQGRENDVLLSRRAGTRRNECLDKRSAQGAVRVSIPLQLLLLGVLGHYVDDRGSIKMILQTRE